MLPPGFPHTKEDKIWDLFLPFGLALLYFYKTLSGGKVPKNAVAALRADRIVFHGPPTSTLHPF